MASGNREADKWLEAAVTVVVDNAEAAHAVGSVVEICHGNIQFSVAIELAQRNAVGVRSRRQIHCRLIARVLWPWADQHDGGYPLIIHTKYVEDAVAVEVGKFELLDRFRRVWASAVVAAQ